MPKDYTHRGWIAAFMLIIILFFISFIPPQTIGGVTLKRVNILSEVLSFDDTQTGSSGKSALFNEADFQVDMQQVAELIVADTTAPDLPITYTWDLPHSRAAYHDLKPDSTRLLSTLVPIEDFDTTGHSPMHRLYDALLHPTRPVRIAVLGDSFIEGDILTCDLRERLQTAYGTPGGVGFAPMSSPLTAFRRTIKTQSKGWTAYNIMQRKNAPTTLRNNFYVSGWVCQPSVGATTRWENSNKMSTLPDSCSQARVLFISTSDSQIRMLLNDGTTHDFTIQGDAAVRQILVSAPQIHSLSFQLLSGAEGFVGYGALFENSAVSVDNYSIRSNNGQAMFWTNPSVNAQVNTLVEYDLVILQYGLNIMQTGIRNYTNYGKQIEKMVAYARQCFPTAAVMILGVSDRSTKTEAGFSAMDAVPYMAEYQRRAARATGAAFWETSAAMQAQGGMERFVANGWAGKDFTHINYAGGKHVAQALFEALNSAIYTRYLNEQQTEPTRSELRDVVDSTLLTRVERYIFPFTTTPSIHNPLK